MTTAPQPAIRHVVAEYAGDGEWVTLAPEGDVDLHRSPEAVLAWVKRHDADHGTGFDVTLIDWRKVPAGFVPPEPA